MLNATGIGHTKHPSSTKTGPGRRHVSGHKKDSIIAKRSGKLGTGWMHKRLVRWIAEKNLQKIKDKPPRSAATPYPVAEAGTVLPTDTPIVAEAMALMDEAAGSTFDTASAEQEILYYIARCGDAGATSREILCQMERLDFNLSDTQVERRLKKLREAGLICYDKVRKGWFPVTE